MSRTKNAIDGKTVSYLNLNTLLTYLLLALSGVYNQIIESFKIMSFRKSKNNSRDRLAYIAHMIFVWCIPSLNLCRMRNLNFLKLGIIVLEQALKFRDGNLLFILWQEEKDKLSYFFLVGEIS